MTKKSRKIAMILSCHEIFNQIFMTSQYSSCMMRYDILR